MNDKTNTAMTAKSSSERALQQDARPEKISRRFFGQLMGLPALMVSGATATMVTACGGGDDPQPQPSPDAATLTRAEFVGSISKYFDWVHSSEYNDPYKLAQPTFVDVKIGVTPGAKEIETALEEGIISNVQGFFYPEQKVTREEAAEIYARAFKVPASSTNALSSFTDVGSLTASRRASINALVAAGYMKGSSATQFAPAAALTAGEAKSIFDSITTQRVAPPQVMCKSGTTAPRRYVRISTPTPGAKIYYTYTFDGTDPADPATAAGIEYDFVNNGVLQFVNPLTSTTDFRLYRLKAVAKKDGMAASAVQTFTWNIVRPQTGAFQAKLVHAATESSPMVWKINNPAEYFQAFVFYIEGTTRGLVFDAGEYS
ncbi:MAG: hypothetical protein JWR60_2445, partial [Polaromonas sp.]|nr:hypothetical protein [Polaromonas sp.]